MLIMIVMQWHSGRCLKSRGGARYRREFAFGFCSRRIYCSDVCAFTYRKKTKRAPAPLTSHKARPPLRFLKRRHTSSTETREDTYTSCDIAASLDSTGCGAKKRGHPISLQIFWKFHNQIAWKLVNLCNIICWTQSLTFCLKISSRCGAT